MKNHYQLFMERCKTFNESIEFLDYVQAVCKCLVMSNYNYSVIDAINCVLINIEYIEILYKEKETVYNCMLEIGYTCG